MTMQIHPTRRRFFMILLLFIGVISINAQKEEITVIGTMTDKHGEAIPGLTVFIEGTQEGTITDINGNYSIKAPLGSTLVFSFIGMKTQRAIVTRSGLNPKGTRKIIPYNYTTKETRFKREQEIQTLKDSLEYEERMKKYRRYLADSLVLKHYERTNVRALDMGNAKAKRQVRRYTDPYGERPFLMGNIMVESDVSFLTTGRLPQLQTDYTQGRPINGQLTYRGPETGEYFSWGPPISNLEFDGIPTSNDRNGSLVLRGTGNGKAAIAYKPKDFFQTGINRTIGLTSYQTIYGVKTNLIYQNERGTGVIPNEENTQHTFRFKLNWDERLKASVNFSNNDQRYADGLMQSRTLAGVYLTPVSFDNANGLSSKEALKQTGNIYHPDGTIRSASPGKLDNPYFIVREGLNTRKIKSFNYNVDFNEDWNTGSIDVSVSGELFRDKRYLYFPELMVGQDKERSSLRQEKLENYFMGANFSNNLYTYKLRLIVPFRAEFYNYTRELNLNGLEQPVETRKRQALMGSPFIQYNHNRDLFLIKAGTNVYASSTSDKTYVRPNIGFYLNPFNIMDALFFWDTHNVFQKFKLRYDYHTVVNEYSLQTPAGLSNSLFYNVSDFNSYFEDREIDISDALRPELVTKHDLSLETSFLNGRLITATTFYLTNRENSIFPVVDDNELVFKNVGEIKTKGWEQEISAQILNHGFKWNSKLLISQAKPELVHLEDNRPIAIAGFKDVHTAFVTGQTPGVIRGSAFMRNTQGQMIIGDDGFPITKQELAVIGDPNPDYLIGLSNQFSSRGWSWGLTIDCVIGGDVLNGTQATLDYYGVSITTANQRHISDYIFDGVRLDGSVNNILVDFAPKDGMEEDNRWVRYGVGGVAEEYIEDASRLVLKELYFSYSFPKKTIIPWGLEQLSLSLYANNLVTITGYRGNLGSNTLWGHHNTMGLDYFNSPQIRRYGASLKLTF